MKIDKGEGGRKRQCGAQSGRGDDSTQSSRNMALTRVIGRISRVRENHFTRLSPTWHCAYVAGGVCGLGDFMGGKGIKDEEETALDAKQFRILWMGRRRAGCLRFAPGNNQVFQGEIWPGMWNLIRAFNCRSLSVTRR